MEVLKNFFVGGFWDPLKSFLMRVLPVSPFRQYLQGYEDGGSGLLAAINYFVPISVFIAIGQAWVTVMFLYYLYHGLIARIWQSSDKSDLKAKATFIGRIIGVAKKFFGKL